MAKTVKKEYFEDFEKCEKLAVVATIDDLGDPHMSLLTTLMAADERTMTVGQFTQGISKANMAKRPKSGFAIVSLDQKLWTGFVNWKDVKTEGDIYIKYNNMQMWRFNTYFGIEKVHYGDLVSITDKEALNILGIGLNALKVKRAVGKMKGRESEDILRPYAVKLCNTLGNPKFLSFINKDGYPVVAPVVQAQPSLNDRMVFTAKPYAHMFEGLEAGARVALFAVSMATESVLVKGVFSGFTNDVGYLDIDKVYNSMPPVSKYTYPYEDYVKVESF